MKMTAFYLVFTRLALASGFLSAVASRLGYWGARSSGWKGFVNYTAQVNSFLPEKIIPAVAVASTFLESLLGILLLIGWKTQEAAWGAAILTFLFGIAMTLSFGIKEPFDYSVFAFTAAALLLAAHPETNWSIDALLKNIK